MHLALNLNWMLCHSLFINTWKLGPFAKSISWILMFELIFLALFVYWCMAWQVALFSARADRQVCWSFPQSQYSSTPGKTGVRALCQGGRHNGGPSISTHSVTCLCHVWAFLYTKTWLALNVLVVTTDKYSAKISAIWVEEKGMYEVLVTLRGRMNTLQLWSTFHQ